MSVVLQRKTTNRNKCSVRVSVLECDHCMCMHTHTHIRWVESDEEREWSWSCSLFCSLASENACLYALLTTCTCALVGVWICHGIAVFVFVFFCFLARNSWQRTTIIVYIEHGTHCQLFCVRERAKQHTKKKPYWIRNLQFVSAIQPQFNCRATATTSTKTILSSEIVHATPQIWLIQLSGGRLGDSAQVTTIKIACTLGQRLNRIAWQFIFALH